MVDTAEPRATEADVERFRLRTFIEAMIEAGEVEVHDEPVSLAAIARHLDGNPKAVLFREAGPEGAELVGNVMASRRRLALSLGVEERALLPAVSERLRNPIPPIEISSAASPVHQVVMEGGDVDLTALPVHLQHALDGAPYISASVDYSLDPATGFTNIGMRRLMLRGRRETGIDLVAPSDLKALYGEAHARGQTLPLAFVVGSHPADSITAVSMLPPQDDIALIGALRGAPVPVVKCVTSDLRVPADAELVIEGYLAAAGWVAPEGPFGEYVGYYGRLKNNPVFHVTAITRRRDALFQTVTIGGRYMETTDTAQLTTLRTEASVWRALETSVREPVAVYATASCGGMYNLRLSLRQRVPGEARNAIAAVFGSTADVKHVFVTDDDIDIFSHEQMDWALATRFQADRDLVTGSGFRVVPLDPSLSPGGAGAKAGFDLTLPFGRADAQEFTVPEPPTFEQRERRSVRAALEAGPKFFRELMEAVGTDDGRDVVRDLEPLYAEGSLARLEDGRYCLDGEDAGKP